MSDERTAADNLQLKLLQALSDQQQVSVLVEGLGFQIPLKDARSIGGLVTLTLPNGDEWHLLERVITGVLVKGAPQPKAFGDGTTIQERVYGRP